MTEDTTENSGKTTWAKVHAELLKEWFHANKHKFGWVHYVDMATPLGIREPNPWRQIIGGKSIVRDSEEHPHATAAYAALYLLTSLVFEPSEDGIASVRGIFNPCSIPSLTIKTPNRPTTIKERAWSDDQWRKWQKTEVAKMVVRIAESANNPTPSTVTEPLPVQKPVVTAQKAVTTPPVVTLAPVQSNASSTALPTPGILVDAMITHFANGILTPDKLQLIVNGVVAGLKDAAASSPIKSVDDSVLPLLLAELRPIMEGTPNDRENYVKNHLRELQALFSIVSALVDSSRELAVHALNLRTIYQEE